MKGVLAHGHGAVVIPVVAVAAAAAVARHRHHGIAVAQRLARRRRGSGTCLRAECSCRYLLDRLALHGLYRPAVLLCFPLLLSTRPGDSAGRDRFLKRYLRPIAATENHLLKAESCNTKR